MKTKWLWIFIGAAVLYLSVLLWLGHCHEHFADFVLRCLMTFGIFGAVLAALFGDYLKEKIFPINVRIEVPEESNTVIDKCELGGHVFDVYVHHLVVKNLTPHRTIHNARVWLKKIFVRQVNGDWTEQIKFAVPRLMQWAPSEYPSDSRSFSKQQVFDLGRTIANNSGFMAAYHPAQGGAVTQQFPVGARLRFVFFVTADNYQKEEEFIFEISIPPSVPGTPVTPSVVTAVKT